MGKQVVSRLSGDDYQHLYSWLQALELLNSRWKVSCVIVEDETAGSIDDVTLLHEPDAPLPDRYHQVKYHVDQRGAYSAEMLISSEKGGKSLLKKWYRSWEKLQSTRAGKPTEVRIVSNWSWESKDELAALVDGRSNALKDEFFTAGVDTKPGKLRVKLAGHLGVTPDRFSDFARTLRFDLGYSCWEEMAARTSERMELLKLRFDENALLTSVSIVREWIKAGRQELDKDELEKLITTRDLWAPSTASPGVAVYMSTIKEQVFDVTPDYVLDWRHYFAEGEGKGGHEPSDPEAWNEKMMPELQALEARVGAETALRLVRARGLARLSAWSAFGYVFCDVARYTIEVDQQGALWRSDEGPSADLRMIPDPLEGSMPLVGGRTVVVGISITSDLRGDVRKDLARRAEAVKAELYLRPDRELGRGCLKSAGDAVAMSDSAKEMIREFVKCQDAERLLLYYLGPLGGACFLGHRLNAVCREIQIMEWAGNGYVCSFTLK